MCRLPDYGNQPQESVSDNEEQETASEDEDKLDNGY